jgi:hypothetical protein
MHMSGNDNCNARYDVTLYLQQHMQWPIRWDKKNACTCIIWVSCPMIFFPRLYTKF